MQFNPAFNPADLNTSYSEVLQAARIAEYTRVHSLYKCNQREFTWCNITLKRVVLVKLG